MSSSVVEKVTIVTGSAGGLGKAISQHFLQAGAHVVLCDVNEAALEATYNEFKDLGKCISIKLDVSSSSSVQEMFEKTINHFGKIDILVNNAGIMDKFDGAADCEESLWHRVLAINLTGPYLTTKQAVKQFLTQNSPGVILNISSLSGFLGHRAGVAYTSSKHGLIGLTKNTAVAYAANRIRCNAICPGAMHTNIGVAMAGGINQAGYQILEKTLASNPGTCDIDQVANLAVFLCGSETTVLNGAIITADLGWSVV